MAYTRAWDETFPPDTQAANLLGQDIRNEKTDTRERIASFGAGVLGSRPTPEAVFAGVIYFATDNGKMYRWNGASWDDVTSTFFASPTGVTGNWSVGGDCNVTGSITAGANLSVAGTATISTLNNGTNTAVPVVGATELDLDWFNAAGITLRVNVAGVFSANAVLSATTNVVGLVWSSPNIQVFIDGAFVGVLHPV